MATTASAVGYVNVVLTSGYTFVANPLSLPPNQLTNVIGYLPTGSHAYFWDVTNQVFLPRATYGVGGWNINYDLPVGRGVVLHVPTRFTNTFIGDVVQGLSTNYIAGGNQYSLVGSKVPTGGSLSSGPLSFPLLDGASVHFFRSPSQVFSDAYTCLTNFGWIDPTGIAGTNGPSYVVGESFVVQNPGPPTNWIQNFALLAPAPPAEGESLVRRSAASPVEVPISGFRVNGGGATLQWTALEEEHDVQFSSDGVSWSTIAAGVAGGIWTGPLPDPVQGRFRIVVSASAGGGQ